uniref:SBP-type domain-containing protein n=1 Tax=Auxenochlorella protothecoides TaxID=3075 RepID=A0A1D1ZP12_AUXPR
MVPKGLVGVETSTRAPQDGRDAEGELVATTQTPGSPSKDTPLPPPRVRRGRPRNKQQSCQITDCQANLSLLGAYHKRYRVCDVHMRSLSVPFRGVDSRFCQQCGRFQELSAFDGEHRSCRERLLRHAGRRRRQSFLNSISNRALGRSSDEDSHGTPGTSKSDGGSACGGSPEQQAGPLLPRPRLSARRAGVPPRRRRAAPERLRRCHGGHAGPLHAELRQPPQRHPPHPHPALGPPQPATQLPARAGRLGGAVPTMLGPHLPPHIWPQECPAAALCAAGGPSHMVADVGLPTLRAQHGARARDQRNGAPCGEPCRVGPALPGVRPGGARHGRASKRASPPLRCP